RPWLFYTAACFAALALGLLSVGIWLAVSANTRLAKPRPSHLLLDRQGRYLGEVPGEAGDIGYWPLPPMLPERIVTVTLETEDRLYYEHTGVRFGSLLRAAWQNVSHARVVSGGSTLPMQVARMQRPAARSLWAKFRE